MSDIAYDAYAVEHAARNLDLRAPNQAALDAIAKALDGAERGRQIVVDLATGTGKTYIAGGLLDYLFEAGVRNVVIVTPGSTIQRKTIENLTPGSRKYLKGLQCRPVVITAETLERGAVAQALEDEDAFKVFVFTVQSLLRPNQDEKRRFHRPHETLGQSLSQYLQAASDLVVVADEHHVYFGKTAKAFRAAINALEPAALVGLTATPDPATVKDVVFEYPLSDAIADGFVKTPVLVARQEKVDWRTQLADGVRLLDTKAAAMRSYCDATRQAYVEPVMFVVAQTIDQANDIRDILASPELLGGNDKVLLVTSDQPDETLDKLDRIEDVGSPVRAVVSVDMLKEGWDVKNIYVIAAVRQLESELLTEQILGRGLRLPFGRYTGNRMLDTVEVLSHNSFRDLLAQAEVLLAATLGSRCEDTEIVEDERASVTESAAQVASSFDVVLPVAPRPAVAAVAVTLDDFDGWWDDEPSDAVADDSAPTVTEVREEAPRRVAMQFATVEARTGAAGEQLALTHLITPRKAAPLFLPKVTTKPERAPFSLADLDLTAVKAQGARFAEDDLPTLTRKAVEAARDDAGVAHVQFRDLDDAVAATVQPVLFQNIASDLTRRLLADPSIQRTRTEQEAAVQIAQAFMAGAEVTEDTPWRKVHGQAATAALVEWIGKKRADRPVRQVHQVELVEWPVTPTRVEPQELLDRHRVTDRDKFRRRAPYNGWTRALYPVNSFDSYTGEFKLAELLERSDAVTLWARFDFEPFEIAYARGFGTAHYRPDFVVVEGSGEHWIVEGKADKEMGSDDVLAKERAAGEWVQIVNGSDDVPARWSYLLASETVIKTAGSWAALKAAGRAHC